MEIWYIIQWKISYIFPLLYVLVFSFLKYWFFGIVLFELLMCFVLKIVISNICNAFIVFCDIFCMYEEISKMLFKKNWKCFLKCEQFAYELWFGVIWGISGVLKAPPPLPPPPTTPPSPASMSKFPSGGN